MSPSPTNPNPILIPQIENQLHFGFEHKVEKHSGFRCLYTNTDCLHNKIDEIEIFSRANKIDLIAITETLPKNDAPDKANIKFSLEGYEILQNNHGRGVCIFYKDSLTLSEIPLEENSFSCSLYCNVKTNSNDTFIIGVVYRSPNSNEVDNNKLIEQINYVCTKSCVNRDKLVLLGDFNFPEIDWTREDTTIRDENNKCNVFLSCVHENYLTQFIKQDTHARGEQTPTLIDLVLSNYPDFIFDIKFSNPFGNSHHSAISASLLI